VPPLPRPLHVLLAAGAIALALGLLLVLAPGPHSIFRAAPDPFFLERAAPRPSWRWLLPPALAGLGLALYRLRRRVASDAALGGLLLLVGWGYLAAWPGVDGPLARELERPFADPGRSYWPDAEAVRPGAAGLVVDVPGREAPVPFFAGYPELIRTPRLLGLHARTHPPLAVGALVGLRRLGLDRLGAALVMPLAAAACALVVFWFLRRPAGRDGALAAALLLLAAPQLGLYAATTLDAVFALALTVALLAYARWLESGRPAALAAFAAAWAVGVHMSYTVLLGGLVLVLVAVLAFLRAPPGDERRVLTRVAWAVLAGVAALLLVAAACGFDPAAVFGAARRNQALLEVQWGRQEHALYWRVGGLLAYLTAVGPPLAGLAAAALAVGPWTRRRLDPFRGQGLLVAALFGVAAALATGRVLGEGERILIVLTPAVVAGLGPAAGAFVRERPRAALAVAGALVAQTFAVEALADTQW